MKKLLKVLFLGALTVGMTVGCDEKKQTSGTDTQQTGTTSETDSGSTGQSGTGEGGGTTNPDDQGGSGTGTTTNPDDQGGSGTGTTTNPDDNPEKTVTGYSLATQNVKANYTQGDNLDLTNLKVYKNYSDNTKEEVTAYTVSPANGSALNEAGKVTVSVTVEGVADPLTFEVDVAKAPKTEWTSEEVTLMSTNLYGVVLPFTGFDESYVTYVGLYGVIVIYGGDVSTNTFLMYARALSSCGFIRISDDEYKFRKVVTTEQGERAVVVSYKEDENGKLFIQAYDPYYYEFPTAAAEYLAYYNFDSRDVIPAFTADRYEIDEKLTAIYCTVNSETAEADYTASLKDAKWDVKEVKDDTGFLSAVSPDGRYAVQYYYDTTLGVFCLTMTPATKWSYALVEGFFDKYNGPAVDIPAVEVENGLYQFFEYPNNDMYYENREYEQIHATYSIYNASEEIFEEYLKTLDRAFWVVKGSEHSYTAKYEIEDEGLLKVEVSFDPETNSILVFLYTYIDEFPDNYFPAPSIARNLGSDITDRVPEFVGENNGFSNVMVDDDYAVLVEVEEGKEQEAADAYIETIQDFGYEPYGGFTTTYVSPNGQILVQARNNKDGTISIVYWPAPTEHWNTVRIPRIIKDYFNSKDALPVYTGGWEYNTDEHPNIHEVDIFIYVEDDMDIDEEVAVYEGMLEEAGFTFFATDPYDDSKIYLSPSKEYYANVYNDDGFYLSIYLFPITTWPSSLIDNVFYENNFEDSLPEYDGDHGAIIAVVDADDKLVITVTCDDSQQAMSDYIELLIDEEFSLVTEDETSKTYVSKNEEFTVKVSYSDTGFEIEVEAVATVVE